MSKLPTTPGDGITCPECGSKTAVTNSYNYGAFIVRQRKCTACPTTLKTRERIARQQPHDPERAHRLPPLLV